MSGNPSVVVVGAGIVGASLAYHLAATDAAVTLIDEALPAAGATARSFAWVNVVHGVAADYARLRNLAIDDYHRLQEELGGALSIDWSGALTWSADPSASEQVVAEHTAWGYDVRLLDAQEIAGLEPNLAVLPPVAAYAPTEGALDPVAATRTLVAAAVEKGARLITHGAVAGLDLDDRRIAGVRLENGTLEADVVVLAAGTGSTSLCAGIGVHLPVSASPALLLRFRAPPGLVRRIVSNDELEVREGGEGRLLVAENHAEGEARDALAGEVLKTLRRHFRDSDGVELLDVEAGWRPMPADGMPIVGFVPSAPNLYLAVMHAGIVMAPVMGRLAVEEVVRDHEVDVLASCRLSRF